MLKSKPMKLKASACVILVALLIAPAAMRWYAQDRVNRVRRQLSVEPSAWSTPVETLEAMEVPQVLADEDIGPGAISVKDNPA